MNTEEFWALIDRARQDATSPIEVAGHVTTALAARDVAEITGCDRHIRRVLDASYRVDLWGAAYLVNGGCSAEGFDHFRGWLMTQGRQAFARAVTDPDTLAELPAVRRAAVTGEEFECAAMLDVARAAHLKVAGIELPKEAPRQPDLNDFWDFDDEDEVHRRLPRLATLFQEPPAE
ncbi:DUF4240 domain-containing protein [Actinomycetes bacterium KLBMP 9797]